MKQWHHKHSNDCLCDTSHLCTSQSAIQSLGISFAVDLNSLLFSTNQQTIVLSVKYWQAVGLFSSRILYSEFNTVLNI